MFRIRQTTEFSIWLSKLKDFRANTQILRRIERIRNGNFGDHKSLSSKISELRITYGPGYRIYYTMRENVIVLLLIGGDKSTQKADIQKAKDILQSIGDNA